jgi:protein SCO1/2
MRFLYLIAFLLNSFFLNAASDTLTLKTPRGGPFAINTTEGFLNSERLIGKHVFLFFGFISCPNVCPLTLQKMKKLVSKLTPNERANFKFLFISVDNERDTIQKLVDLKKVYGDSLIGAVDSDERLTEIASSFGARYRRFKNKKGQLIVDHTDSIFHIDQQGNWINTIPYGTSVEGMLQYLRAEPVASKVSDVRPERRAKLLATNKECDLSKESCSLSWEKVKYTLSLSPKPIMVEKEFTVRLEVSGQGLLPKMLDVEGVNINMGYIRPSFTKTGGSTFESRVTLPVCELDKMSWVIRLILEDQKGSLFYLDYRLRTE